MRAGKLAGHPEKDRALTGARIEATGEIDATNAPELRSRVYAAVDENPGAVVTVDLSGVEFLDSTGLGVLVGARPAIARGNQAQFGQAEIAHDAGGRADGFSHLRPVEDNAGKNGRVSHTRLISTSR